MQERDTKWTPMKALGKSQKEVADWGIPPFEPDLSEKTDLEFSNLMNYDNRQLEEFLTMFGGYKAYLETKVADVDAKLSAHEAAFNESYSKALWNLASEYQESGSRKPTKEELRGAIFTRYPALQELRRDVIDLDTLKRQTSGLLNTYTTAYNTVSRVVALRTYGGQLT